MSRQDKVNPGIYTQRGRLTQDDAARELKKQREAGSTQTEGGPFGETARPRVTEKDKTQDDESEPDE